MPLPGDTALLPVDTAFGLAGLIYRAEPFLLVRSLLPGTDFFKGKRVTETPVAQAKALAKMLRDYFSGRPITTPWELLDRKGLTPLQQDVLAVVAAIPFGRTRSYGEVARLAGRPGAARFVGSTMAKNPFPVFIPCHRVVRNDGSPGGFGGGTPLKARMLALEARPYPS